MVNILKFFSIQYFLMMIIMFFSRLLFVFYNFEKIESEILKKDFFLSFLIGFRVDSSIAGFWLLILVIISWKYLFFNKVITKLKNGFLKISVFFNIVLCFFASLTLVASVEYFKTFGIHINSSIFMFTGKSGGTEEIFWTIIEDYNVILDFIFIFIMVTFYGYFSNKNFNKNLPNIGRNSFGKITYTGTILGYIIVILISVIMARGGLGPRPIQWGDAYFSSSNFANNMAMNGIFTLGKTTETFIKEGSRDIVSKIKRYTGEELKAKMRDYLEEPENAYLKVNQKNPFIRVTDTKKPEKKYNVVMIILEGFMAEYCGACGGNPDVTHYFNELSKKGKLFTNFYSTGTRTTNGIIASVASFPSHTGEPVMKRILPELPFIPISMILKERGYTTHFVYGGDIEFDNMKSFFKVNGYDTITEIHDFSPDAERMKWGVVDHELYKKALEISDKLKEPFFLNILTLSNHAPYYVPKKYDNLKKYEGYFQKEILNVYEYSDIALGEFMEAIQKKPFFKNTVFIFVADHGQTRDINKNLDRRKFRIPLLFYTPNGELEPEIIDKVGVQMDILPSLMWILGGKYIHSSFGKNLFLNNKRNAAYIKNSEGDNFFGIIEDEYMLVDHYEIEDRLYKFNKNKPLEDEIEIDKNENYEIYNKMKELSRVYLEVNEMLLQGKYSW